ncbi:MAG: LysR family transcriptional regulator [Pseudomonadota bacterium]
MNTAFSPTIKQLRAFLAVYRLRKLGAAAVQLFVTQSAISVLIRQLEEGLQARLFDRTTRSLQPTQAAHDAAVVAERILRDVDSLGAAFGDLTVLRRGRVCFAITPTLASILLPEAIRRFTALHPEVQLVVDDCAPEQFSARVLGDHVDFGIGTPERAGGELELQTLMRDQLCLVCLPHHPLASIKNLRWRDLEGYRVIAGRPGYGVRQLVDVAAANAGITLQVVNEISFLSTGLWMTASGMAPSIMPSAYATFSQYAYTRELVVRRLGMPKVSRDIFVVTKKGRSLSSACQSFLDVLRLALKQGAPAGLAT